MRKMSEEKEIKAAQKAGKHSLKLCYVWLGVKMSIQDKSCENFHRVKIQMGIIILKGKYVVFAAWTLFLAGIIFI